MTEKKKQKDNINPTYYVGAKIQVSDFISESDIQKTHS